MDIQWLSGIHCGFKDQYYFKGELVLIMQARLETKVGTSNPNFEGENVRVKSSPWMWLTLLYV